MSLVERARRAMPLRAVPAVARGRAWWALRDRAARDLAREHMELLLGVARPGADLDRAAVAFTRAYLARPELHRRPDFLHHQLVLGLEHLAAAAALGRGVVLHFLHHGLSEGSLTSLGRQGLLHDVIAEPELLGDDLTPSRRAYADLFRPYDLLRSTEIGTGGMIRLLREGRTLAVATDRPGRTAVTFCGRRLYSASGAVRISIAADAPVVAMTADQLPTGHVVGQLHPAVEPTDFATPGAMLQHLVSLHEPSVLAWPEAYVFPRDCWGSEQIPLPLSSS